jgi:sugar phosphate isomerase/epimerase
MSIASPSPHFTRRGLVATGAGAVGALALGRGAAAARAEDCVPPDPDANTVDAVGTNLPPSRIGLQMYSVRDQPAKMGGMPAVLTALHEIGYRTVEFAGGFTTATIATIKATMDDLGMRAVSNHGSMNQASIDSALALGMTYTGQGSIPSGSSTDSWKQTAEDFNTFGQLAVSQGLKGFAPHMHTELWSPVADDPMRRGIDVMLENTDPNLVFFEMDIYWAYMGAWENGVGMLFDPADWVIAHPTRFPLFHVKDGHATTRAGGATLPYNTDGPSPLQESMTDVHQGDIDFRTFFSRLAAVSPLENHYFLWERDNASSHSHGSLSSARASFAAMRFDHLAGPSRY